MRLSENNENYREPDDGEKVMSGKSKKKDKNKSKPSTTVQASTRRKSARVGKKTWKLAPEPGQYALAQYFMSSAG